MHPTQPPVDLSQELTQALAMEEYHREQLLWWKKRRSFLESQIPTDNPLFDFIMELGEDDNSETKPAGH